MLTQLSDISIALTSQSDVQELLLLILTEAKRIANCEGGSLFLIENKSTKPELVFKLALNSIIDFPFVESRLPLDQSSIIGYVASTGKELNIDDVYALPSDLPYSFNRAFDEKMGYKTQGVLTIPMRDHRNEVVGALQFINPSVTQHSTAINARFNEDLVEVLRAIASQAAVTLQKTNLLEDINQLFESFVQASVKTIEQRDPTTSGHSLRVAQTTVELFTNLPKSGDPEFRNLHVSQENDS